MIHEWNHSVTLIKLGIIVVTCIHPSLFHPRIMNTFTTYIPAHLQDSLPLLCTPMSSSGDPCDQPASVLQFQTCSGIRYLKLGGARGMLFPWLPPDPAGPAAAFSLLLVQQMLLLLLCHWLWLLFLCYYQNWRKYSPLLPRLTWTLK